MGLWVELLIVQTIIGYCFVMANDLIGIYNIRDLNNMKGDITLVKAHKRIGWIETTFFYSIAIQCLIMVFMALGGSGTPPFLSMGNTSGIHFWIGGMVGAALFSFKFIIAHFKKNIIYKYGQFIGPIGFVGWSIAHWTSMVNYFFYYSGETIFLPKSTLSFIVAALIPFSIGTAIFLGVLVKRGGSSTSSRWSVHQIAFILHGITFGYEGAAKDLLGTPALYKYVIPKTYGFLEKMLKDVLGFDLKELEEMNLNKALEAFTKKSAEIGMAEKLKIKWESDHVFTIESVNCSTAKVRSVMKPEELSNAICPWAIMAAAIVNKSTGKDLEIAASEFNEIGALTRVTLKQ